MNIFMIWLECCAACSEYPELFHIHTHINICTHTYLSHTPSIHPSIHPPTHAHHFFSWPSKAIESLQEDILSPRLLHQGILWLCMIPYHGWHICYRRMYWAVWQCRAVLRDEISHRAAGAERVWEQNDSDSGRLAVRYIAWYSKGSNRAEWCADGQSEREEGAVTALQISFMHQSITPHLTTLYCTTPHCRVVTLCN